MRLFRPDFEFWPTVEIVSLGRLFFLRNILIGRSELEDVWRVQFLVPFVCLLRRRKSQGEDKYQAPTWARVEHMA